MLSFSIAFHSRFSRSGRFYVRSMTNDHGGGLVACLLLHRAVIRATLLQAYDLRRTIYTFTSAVSAVAIARAVAPT